MKVVATVTYWHNLVYELCSNLVSYLHLLSLFSTDTIWFSSDLCSNSVLVVGVPYAQLIGDFMWLPPLITADTVLCMSEASALVQNKVSWYCTWLLDGWSDVGGYRINASRPYCNARKSGITPNSIWDELCWVELIIADSYSNQVQNSTKATCLMAVVPRSGTEVQIVLTEPRTYNSNSKMWDISLCLNCLAYTKCNSRPQSAKCTTYKSVLILQSQGLKILKNRRKKSYAPPAGT